MTTTAHPAPECAIAIVGCAGRFPGAPDVAAFWNNLCAGVESISAFSEQELEDAFSADVRARADFVKGRSILDGVAEFDAGFFGMQAREAELTDPQHRIFLECAWQALEDAGYDPARFDGSIGVIAGSSIGSYFLRNVLADRSAIARFTSEYPVAGYPELLGSGYDFLATRVAYKLNLRGPAMTLQSACSTSLLAVTQAAQALMLGQADMMLAGGVSITFPQRRGYVYQEGGMVSPDGHCRTFDATANGTVFGDGAGVVVLKRLDDALADNDSIYAVIRGFGVNNDGSAKVGYTAPSIEGQTEAVRAAHAMARFEPHTIGLVECHGTATPLGDPIELTALKKAFGPVSAEHTCALGSVKTNVGHLDVAAGVTGLIKAALAVRSGTIPPTLHFNRPNPHVDLDGGPFFVNTQPVQWPNANATRRAAVSAFGVGGTNVHVVLESAPERVAAPSATAPHLLVLSARSAPALEAARTQLATHLRSAGDTQRLTDVAHTLQAGRRAFAFRSTVVATTPEQAADALSRPLPATRAVSGEPTIGFLFPGQGSQYLAMGRGLYQTAAPFRAAFDACAEILQPHLGCDLRALVFEGTDAAALTSTEIAQPALFAIEYATAKLLASCGIEAAAAAGHSVGEFVAAALAGVFSLEDALMLVAERGRLMAALPRGAMLAVRASEADLSALLEDVDIAAINAPSLCVAAGTFDAVERLERRLAARSLTARRLHTSHAFHSAMMEPALDAFAAAVARVRLSAPLTPFVSSVSGTWITPEEALSPSYWVQHVRRPVRFADAVHALVDAGVDTLVEAGPGANLTTLALQGAAKGGRALAIPTLPGNERERLDLEAFLEALGRLWSAGAAPDWSALTQPVQPARVALPTYPFERSRYWIEQKAAPAAVLTELSSPQPPVIHTTTMQETPLAAPTPAARVRTELVALLEDLSGESLADADPRATFLELGFDSLSLGRFVAQIQPRLGVTVSFRQLLSDIPSLEALTDFVSARLPAGHALAAAPAPTTPAPSRNGSSTHVDDVVREQLEAMQRLMQSHLQTLKELGVAAPAPTPAAATPPASARPAEPEAPSRLDAFRVTPAPKADITAEQRAHIDELVARTVARTGESKRMTQRYRGVLADPRVAAGFRNEWKEMVYPITCARAKGSRLWDADGNEYIDILNGFGQTAFGHAPDFVIDAVHAQLDRGFAIGPQTELAGEVAELFCEMTGNERVTFCNTGSEAVMAAMRVARTVTNRERIVVFEGAYHGQFDEVLVKSARTSRRSLPVALGIPAESVANITVLPYGTPESLEWIREHCNELAAVVVESVQSRHPALRPQEFLREVREVTQSSGTALVFDEVVTGFRMHPGGMQALFGIRADLATYGKVVGGGLPIGILAGNAKFMDALDGGSWQYGDDSFPEVAPTFLAGTFVRHPLAMAAVLAVLRHIKAQGPALQEAIGARTAALVARLNDILEQRGIASRIETFGSLFYLSFAHEDRLAGLLYYHLRLRGIYVQEGFPSFLTTEHTDADVDAIVAAFDESLDELQGVGILAPRIALQPAPAAAGAEASLTEEQTEVWLAAQAGDEASCAFNESVTLHLNGTLNVAAFERAWQRLVLRHDALRASFGTTGESMRIGAEHVALTHLDHTSLAPAERATALAELVDAEARTPFDLAVGPVARAALVRATPQEHAFVFTAHHIVCDGWSVNVLLTELATIYGTLLRGEEPALAPALAFSAYAQRQARRDPADLARVEAYWLEQFATAPPLLDLPTDRPRPAHKSYAGATRTVFVAAAEYKAIKKAGARYGCTLFATLLAGFDLLIGRLASQDDVVVGIPAAGQALLEGETLVGHCVDFLPIRSHPNAGEPVSDFLAGVKRHVLDAYEHQQYTLGTLVRRLALQRETNRVPLAEIQFNLERLATGLDFAGLTTRVEPNAKAFVNFDLFLNVVESEDGLRLDCDYNTDLFDASTIDRWLASYRALLDEIVRDGTQTVGAIDFLPPAEKRVLAELNATAMDYPREQTVIGLVRAQAAQRPGTVAVRFGDEALTYAELERRVDQLARYLAHRVEPGRRVAVCVQRTANLPVALLAVHAAGCAYVPLDPSHPPARLQRILRDANVAAIVVDGSFDAAALAGETPVVDLSANARDIAAQPATPPRSLAADDAAYVIYTSGSTGEPKGVEVTQRSVVNLLLSMAREPGLSAGDTLLAVTTPSFDIAALELFLPLVTGATVIVAARDEVADAFVLAQRLRTSGITAMQATPALWSLVVETGFLPPAGLKMLCGGEALGRELANRLLAGGAELWNVYGPTETTIWSACARVAKGDAPIVVGRPIANTQMYVLDANDRVVPVGAVGELHIAGDGVARGYVNLPELTAQRFRANPFGSGTMYRTGDNARVLPDGTLAVLGRRDHQIKLRGFRIELGEIETVLRRQPGVSDAAVALREDVPGEQRLAAYFTTAGAALDAAALRRAAAQELPDYMVPAAWVHLERMPLTPAGKLDRNALPVPEPAAPASEAFRPAETPTERALAEIWADVLHLERVGLDDDFFALGGDSIQLFQITARANSSGMRLAAKELLRHPTVATLARRLDDIAREPQGRPSGAKPVAIARRRPLETRARDEHALVGERS